MILFKFNFHYIFFLEIFLPFQASLFFSFKDRIFIHTTLAANFSHKQTENDDDDEDVGAVFIMCLIVTVFFEAASSLSWQ